MTSFVLTAEELKSAPAEVRNWFLARIEADLLALAAPAPATAAAHAPQLAACTLDEAARILEMIRGDVAATHVFLELAREISLGDDMGELHAMSIGNLMRHTRLDNGGLISCLQAINQAFRQVRRDPEAMLFAFDQANHVYVHAATHQSIRSLWQELVQLHRRPPEEGAEPYVDPAVGFAPRRLGPSQDVVTHREQ